MVRQWPLHVLNEPVRILNEPCASMIKFDVSHAIYLLQLVFGILLAFSVNESVP